MLGRPIPGQHENSTQSSVYLEKWCKKEFGAAAAPVLGEYYRAYFAAPARYGEQEVAVAGDHYYQTVARQLLQALIAGDNISPIESVSGNPRFANLKEMGAFLAKITGEADPRWSKARLLAERAKLLVPPQRRDFFQANVLSQVDYHLHANRMLFHLAQAAADANQGSQILAAIAEGEKLQDALRAADYGKWQGYYTDGDWIVDVTLTLSLMRAYQGKLEGKVVPEGVLVRAKGDFAYTMIKAYQGGQRDQF